MRLGKFALVFAAGLLAATPLMAQQPGGRGRGGFGGFGGFGGGGLTGMLSNNKGLQDELKMDKDQVDKLTEALAKVREDMRDDMAKLRDRQTPMEERTAINKKVNEANEKAVASVLKPDQVKRLHQIENQQAGMNVFNKEDVQKVLKLTDAQKDKLEDINKELQKDIRDLSGGGAAGGGGGRRGGFGGFNPENLTKMQDLRKEAMASAKKALTDDQRNILTKEVLGAPFEVQFGGGFGGGFGGFGGGRGTPGQVLSTGAQDQLKLTADQKKKLEDLQKTVNDQLKSILTEDQQKQLKDMQQGGGRGTGGRGRGRGGNNPTKPNP